MTNYLISLGFWLACAAAFLLYWRRRLDREHRLWKADFDRRCAEDAARRGAQRAKWDEEDAAARAEHEALVAAIDARADRVNQFLIARGLEPVPREPLEPTEPSDPPQ
jgi:hypothetical protein